MSITKEEELMVTIISQDKEIKNLKNDKLKLERKLKLYNKKKLNCKDYHSQIIKKDKVIHQLKKDIKKDFLNFGENMMPKSYMRISKRFPHLTLKEIIDFEKKVRENGGSIKVHSGQFVLTSRDNHTNSHPQHGESCKDKYISWTCCHNWCYTGSGCNKPCRRYIKNPPTDPKWFNRPPHEYTYIGHNLRNAKGAIDLVNRQPDGQCDFPVTFYLDDEDEKKQDEKKQDVSQVKVSEVTTSISHNIKILENTIEEYSNEILKMKELKTNIDLLLS